MSAKESIQDIVNDSIKPYKNSKRKASEMSTDIEVVQRPKNKQKIVVRSFDNRKIVYFIFFVYIIMGIALIVR